MAMMTALLTTTALAWQIQSTPKGTDVHWEQMPITYTFVDDQAPDLPGIDAALDEAFFAWVEVPGTEIDLTEALVQDAEATTAYDGVHAVYFEPDWSWDPDTVALTSLWADEATGEVMHYDIRINGTLAWSTDGTNDTWDLQAAITHEVGHALGLDHSESPDAVMYATQSTGDTWARVLGADDEDAARFLYPSGWYEPPAQAALMGCSTSSGAPTGSLGLLLLGLVMRRRRA